MDKQRGNMRGSMKRVGIYVGMAVLIQILVSTNVVAAMDYTGAARENAREFWGAIKPGNDNPVRAVMVNDMEMLRRTLKPDGSNANMRGFMGDSLLHAAVKKERVEMVQLLLERKADVNARNACGLDSESLFCDGVATGNIRIVELLIEYNADIKGKVDRKNKYSMRVAAEKGGGDMVKLLLAHKVDINARAGV